MKNKSSFSIPIILSAFSVFLLVGAIFMTGLSTDSLPTAAEVDEFIKRRGIKL